MKKDSKMIWGFPLNRCTKITDKILRYYGFVKLVEKDIVGRDIWELRMPFYPHKFRFIKEDFPADNPNCGVLSIHNDACEVSGFDTKGKKKLYKLPSSTHNIAYYVNTAERLRSIILILTESNV